MLDYALEYELVDRNYSRTFNLSEETIKEIVTVKNEHIPFTDEEMDLLWKHADDKMLVDVLLIQCYSGWRPQELGLLLVIIYPKCRNVNSYIPTFLISLGRNEI